ncbi:MAG: MgtC/SapB family protein [Caulobacteraceae bacterium]
MSGFHVAGEVGAAVNLGAAWAAGSLVGIERSFNGRAAGFRTHALVCLAAAATITIALQPTLIAGSFPGGGPRLDPGRFAQGVMTGVGFLGAGVIFKEGVSVQGLTTAACVWAVAAIGLLFGAGLFTAGCLVTAAVLVTLVVFRAVETAIPERVYALATFRFRPDAAPGDEGLRDIVGRGEALLYDISYALVPGGEAMEYRASLQVKPRISLEAVATRVRAAPGVIAFDIARISK